MGCNMFQGGLPTVLSAAALVPYCLEQEPDVPTLIRWQCFSPCHKKPPKLLLKAQCQARPGLSPSQSVGNPAGEETIPERLSFALTIPNLPALILHNPIDLTRFVQRFCMRLCWNERGAWQAEPSINLQIQAHAGTKQTSIFVSRWSNEGVCQAMKPVPP